MRARALSLAFTLAAGSSALGGCGGDYWLGGARASSSRKTTSAPADGGGTSNRGGTADGGGTARVLTADVVLRGGDSYDVSEGDGGTCRLVGNGHSIRSDGTWVGRLTIRGCRIEGLGGGATPAIAVRVAGGGEVTIEGNTFSDQRW